MPVSKRDKKVDLTKVKKKKIVKSDIVSKIQSAIDEYKFVYILQIQNSRNTKLAELRKELSDCKFIFGKNSLMSLAFGKNKETEHKPKLHKLNKFLTGQCCVLLANKDVSELRDIFNVFRSQEFARSGNISPQTVLLAPCALPKFSHTLEPGMRQLGLPVKLIRGVVHLEKEYRVCKRNKALTPEQCRILKMFELQLSEFRVAIIASWSAESGVSDLSEKDSYAQVTSLPPLVRVSCDKLDDGLYYFVPTAIDENDDADDDDDDELLDDKVEVKNIGARAGSKSITGKNQKVKNNKKVKQPEPMDEDEENEEDGIEVEESE